jgi:hypothetical protein
MHASINFINCQTHSIESNKTYVPWVFSISHYQIYALRECFQIWIKYNLKHLIYLDPTASTLVPVPLQVFRIPHADFAVISCSVLIQSRLLGWCWWSVVCPMWIINIWVGAGLGWQTCLITPLWTWNDAQRPPVPKSWGKLGYCCQGQHCCYCLLISQPFMWQYHWGLCWPGGCSSPCTAH